MSQLAPDFITATMQVSAWKHGDFIRAQGALLRMALDNFTITAADLPGELLNGSKTLSGCAAGALINIELLEVCGRIKSPRPDAKGRKVNVMRLKEGRRSAALAWLQANNLPIPEAQQELRFA